MLEICIKNYMMIALSGPMAGLFPLQNRNFEDFLYFVQNNVNGGI
jgi:hypothetical protein